MRVDSGFDDDYDDRDDYYYHPGESTRTDDPPAVAAWPVESGHGTFTLRCSAGKVFRAIVAPGADDSVRTPRCRRLELVDRQRSVVCARLAIARYDEPEVSPAWQVSVAGNACT